MSTERKRLLRVRQQIAKKRPRFRRYESWRYVRVKDNWRRPRGIDNDMRERKKGHIPLVSVGYRGPRKVRGLHPSGKEIVHVRNVQDLEKVDPETQVVYIARGVGLRKRWLIQDRADELGIRILNGQVEERKASEFEEFEEEYEEEEEEYEEEEEEYEEESSESSASSDEEE